MHTMNVTFEWPDELGPRWLNRDNLIKLVDPNGTGTLILKSVDFPDSTAKERAQEEFHQLSARMDKLGALSYKDFMKLENNQRLLLHSQYVAMDTYRQAILARIEAWTDES